MKKTFIIAAFIVNASVYAQVNEFDVNKDGDVNTGDVVSIYNYIIKGEGGNGNNTISLICPDDNHPHLIDLGLPTHTKWACCNVGANTPEEYGNYFAWGETDVDKNEKEDFTWEAYKLCNGTDRSLTKYCTSSSYGTVDNSIELEAEDDAATVRWGNMWQTPSHAQQDELRDECDWTWTNRGGVNGYLVHSRSNNNSIFLPAAGSKWPSTIFPEEEFGCYWSRSYRAWEFDDHALYLNFNASNISPSWYYANGRCAGQSVRPVQKKN